MKIRTKISIGFAGPIIMLVLISLIFVILEIRMEQKLKLMATHDVPAMVSALQMLDEVGDMQENLLNYLHGEEEQRKLFYKNSSEFEEYLGTVKSLANSDAAHEHVQIISEHIKVVKTIAEDSVFALYKPEVESKAKAEGIRLIQEVGGPLEDYAKELFQKELKDTRTKNSSLNSKSDAQLRRMIRELINDEIPDLLEYLELNDEAEDMTSDIVRHIGDIEDRRASFQKNSTSFHKTLTKLRKLENKEQERIQLDKAEKMFVAFREGGEQLFNVYNPDNKALAIEAVHTIQEEHLALIEDHLDQLAEMRIEENRNTLELIVKRASGFIGFLILMTLIFILVSIVIAVSLQKDITDPIIAVREVLNRLKDMSNRLAFLMKEKLAKNNWTEMYELQDLDREVSQLNHMAARTDEIGDMCKAELDVIQASHESGDSINHVIEQINNALNEVNVIIARVTQGIMQVADSSTSLSQGATEQAASLEEISASLLSVGEQTKGNVTSAEKARELAFKASDFAEKGQESMSTLSGAMKKIEENSADTLQVIKTIDDIAFQTNLLALNAAVEAARAGHHGKGFAVVADEVRNLAGRSAKAAQETEQLLQNNSRQIEQGVDISVKTAEALTDICSVIAETRSLIAEITEASYKQNEAIEQVNVGLSEVDVVTQRTAGNSEELASVADDITKTALDLQQLVHTFQLRGAGSREEGDTGSKMMIDYQ